jgi:CBS-domain-containing membrane protein
VTLNRIRATPQERRTETRLADIACRPEELPITHPDEPLLELLPRMIDCSDGRAVVIGNDGHLAGIVTPSDITRAVQLHDLRPIAPNQAPRGADLTAGREQD